MYEGGLTWMRYSISDTAEWGDYNTGPRIITDQTRQVMQEVLDDIRSGRFARRWMDEARAGAPRLLDRRAQERSHQVEQGGAELRNLMPFLVPKSPDS